jgi:hypothetical protein
VIPAKEMSVELTLQVSAVARIPNKPDAAVLLGSKQVKITVNRVLTAPEVSSITANSGTKIREGSYSSVTVLIDDANATSDQSTWPTLIISNPTGKASLAAFTKLNSMTQLPNGQIQATLYIDLSNAELTKSTDSYGLVMKAISAFNKMGTEKSIDFTVMTQLSEPTTTWTSTISAALGTKLDYQFMILDPKSEGVFDQITFSGVPTGAQASCTYVTDSTQSCHLVWTVPANQAIGTVSFSATAVLKNVDYYADSQTSRQVFKYSISVVKSAPVPSQGDLK